jgi:lipoprotein-releasing system permease protein
LNFPFYIAKRYLFSKKKNQAVNIISFIAIIGVGIGSLALVIVLSAFNGLETLVASLYSSFDPEIKISPSRGKTFSLEEFPLEQLQEMQAIAYTSKVLEETVMLRHRGKQCFAKIKGVEKEFNRISKIDSLMYDGHADIHQSNQDLAILGYGIADKLSVFLSHLYEPVIVYFPKKEVNPIANPTGAFTTRPIYSSGIFTINPEFDNKYIITPFGFAAELLNKNNEVSSIEVSLTKGANANLVKEEIKALVGDNFTVETRYELNEIIYKTNNTEKWITFLILSFILVIATFNVLGSLSMLIIEKKKDIFILKSLGSTTQSIEKIFLTEGMLISIIGGLGGISLGIFLVLLQEYFGLVRLSGSIVEFYPVELRLFDFIAVGGIILIIGFFASLIPIKYMRSRFR